MFDPFLIHCIAASSPCSMPGSELLAHFCDTMIKYFTAAETDYGAKILQKLTSLLVSSYKSFSLGFPSFKRSCKQSLRHLTGERHTLSFLFFLTSIYPSLLHYCAKYCKVCTKCSQDNFGGINYCGWHQGHLELHLYCCSLVK